MKVAVTGAQGMLGTHLRAYLRAFEDVEVQPIGRAEFAGDLSGALRGCDVVVHLAGMNRGDEQEVAQTNVALTEQLGVSGATARRCRPRRLRRTFSGCGEKSRAHQKMCAPTLSRVPDGKSSSTPAGHAPRRCWKPWFAPRRREIAFRPSSRPW